MLWGAVGSKLQSMRALKSKYPATLNPKYPNPGSRTPDNLRELTFSAAEALTRQWARPPTSNGTARQGLGWELQNSRNECALEPIACVSNAAIAIPSVTKLAADTVYEVQTMQK